LADLIHQPDILNLEWKKKKASPSRRGFSMPAMRGRSFSAHEFSDTPVSDPAIGTLFANS
jgi:hypothetical protein